MVIPLFILYFWHLKAARLKVEVKNILEVYLWRKALVLLKRKKLL